MHTLQDILNNKDFSKYKNYSNINIRTALLSPNDLGSNMATCPPSELLSEHPPSPTYIIDFPTYKWVHDETIPTNNLFVYHTGDILHISTDNSHILWGTYILSSSELVDKTIDAANIITNIAIHYNGYFNSSVRTLDLTK